MFCGLWLAAGSHLQGVDTPPKADGAGAFATGRYRNLFAEIGKSQPEIRKKVDSAFQQLFHGNLTNESVYCEAGTNANGPLAFITDIKHRDVRSEGLSYGMIIAVQLGKKTEFDAIWNWSKTYLYVSETNHPSFGFFTWQARTNGARMSQFVAPDGEEYYVTALYLAAHRWGNGAGLYNYKEQADELLTRMRHRPVISGEVPWFSGNRTVTAGALFDEAHKMVLFSPSDERARFTDPSYHLPAFYELWARWGPKEDATFWKEAADVSRDYFVNVTHPVTGLNPCYANFDGSLVQRSGSYGTNFSYDAFRTAGNWSVDWSWWAKDPRQGELSDRLQAFFESKGTNYGCVFTLDGQQLESRHAQGLVAVNAVASLAATHPRWKRYVEELWNTPTPDGLERYYEGLLYMMALLHCSGEFRIAAPPDTSAPGVPPSTPGPRARDYTPEHPRSLAPYFVPATSSPKAPDQDGFLQRWLLLEPIRKPNRSNTVFTDTYIRTAFTTEYFPNQFTMVPRAGDKVTVAGEELVWHALDSSQFNVKLFRFADGVNKPTYGVLFWVVTVVDSPQEHRAVRMAVGSNSASMWWLNGKEAVILSGDRRMVMDDCVSKRLTLIKGKNIIRGAVINGPGMSDFCVRFIDEHGEPIKAITMNLEKAGN